MTIHRLIRRGARPYGKARTLCGLDVEGQIHPDAEVFTDRKDLELDLSEPRCVACEASFNGAVAESRARAGYVTVHVLYYGLPLCGYGEGKTPSEWPADHAWLSVHELGRHTGKDRPNWCAECLAKARVGNLPAAAAGTNALDHMRTPKPSPPPSDGLRRFEVWSTRTIGQGGADALVGRAIENRDGTLNVELPELGVRLRLKPA